MIFNYLQYTTWTHRANCLWGTKSGKILLKWKGYGEINFHLVGHSSLPFPAGDGGWGEF